VKQRTVRTDGIINIIYTDGQCTFTIYQSLLEVTTARLRNKEILTVLFAGQFRHCQLKKIIYCQ
jgi:hypothetical protein